MLIRDQQVAVEERFLAIVEGHLIQRGLGLVSSAATGQVVSDPSHEQVEGAAKLPPIERVLVLAKRAKVKCVFQLLRLETGQNVARRYFVLRGGQSVMSEVRQDTFDQFAPARRRFAWGPIWAIEGKVIDVESGEVLAVVGFEASTVDRQRVFPVEELDGLLQPPWDTTGWRFDSPDEIGYLRTLFMDRLAWQIKGTGIAPVIPSPPEPLLPPAD
jgi:hypothetical protein